MNVNVEIAEIHECISQIDVLKGCNEVNVNGWLLMDTNDPGYNILSDDEIVHNLVEECYTEREENKIDDDLIVKQ